MKTKSILFLTTLTVYTFLFYRQSSGINFLIFNVLLIGLSIYLYPKITKHFDWILAATGAIISSIMVVMIHSNLAIIANVISILLMIGVMYSNITSIYVSLFHGFLSAFLPFFQSINNLLTKIANYNGLTYSSNFKFKKYSVFLFPIFVTVVFYNLYSISNPVFGSFITFPEFKISPAYITFIFLGIVGLSGFFNPFGIEKLANWDLNNVNTLNRIKLKINKKIGITALKLENKNGMIMLLMLNILILIFNVFDFSFILTGKKLPVGMMHSEYVHQGVNTLIFSILLAISIILYFFRANQNFYKSNVWLKRLAYIWIIQNVILLMGIIYKNNIYIVDYGLTYKRIGVYVYLLLTVAGLAITFWKLKNLKTIWFIFRKNTEYAYTLLIISSLINWDGYIANYNINTAKSMDIFYLLNLSDNALPHLKSLLTNPKVDLTGKLHDFTQIYNGCYSTFGNKTKAQFIENQIKEFTRRQHKKDWQSCNYADAQILNAIK